jgi:hypothetical protein
MTPLDFFAPLRYTGLLEATMKALIVVFWLAMSGCATIKPNESMENLLNRAKKPVYVVSVYKENDLVYVLFKDASGKCFTINGLQFYSLTAGDILN